jgi:2-phospho-L-lactate guanylyltransferase
MLSSQPVWAVIVARVGNGAKSRLAGALRPDQRRQLALAMLSDVVEVCTRATGVIAGTLAVVDELDARVIVERAGGIALADPGAPVEIPGPIALHAQAAGDWNAASPRTGHINGAASSAGDWNAAAPSAGHMNAAASGVGDVNAVAPGAGRMNGGAPGAGRMNAAASGVGDVNGADLGVGHIRADSGAGHMSRADSGAGHMNRTDSGGGDMNAAVRAGLRAVRQFGAVTAIVVPGDVPLIAAADFEALLEAAGEAQRAVVVGASHDGVGTNALLLRPLDVIVPAFGPPSLQRHVRSGLSAGAVTLVQPDLGLALDIDTPHDLATLLTAHPRRHTQAALDELLVHN